MRTLLHIDCSPLGDASISRHLSSEFVRHWTEQNTGGKVIRRDLNAERIPTIDGVWVAAVFTPEEKRTPAQRETVSLSDRLIEELQSADEYVFGVPMHNFGIPAVLKLWLDQVVRIGKTFSYDSHHTPVGLLKEKKARFMVASGGAYDPGTAMASFNFVEPYLRTIFGFIGVTDTAFLAAGGTGAIMYGKIDRESFLKPHLEKIDGLLQTAAA
ncbi:MAG: NAD(P)H-dependent oxidoreductase [Verrucomicrobia bacterium]|nr:NAD(P)H-dependent oxidoreductase [Verrucomicrobiota bacterium]